MHGIRPAERKMCPSKCVSESDSFGDPRKGATIPTGLRITARGCPAGGATPSDDMPDSGRNPITPEDVQTRPLHAGGSVLWASGIRDRVEFLAGLFLHVAVAAQPRGNQRRSSAFAQATADKQSAATVSSTAAAEQGEQAEATEKCRSWLGDDGQTEIAGTLGEDPGVVAINEAPHIGVIE